MANNELIYDLVLETKQAVQATKELVEKTKTEAGKSGKQAGDEFGKQFKSALTAVVGAISFNFLKNQFDSAIGEYNKLIKSNVALEGAVKVANEELAKTGKSLKIDDVNNKVDELFKKFKGAISKNTISTAFSDFFRSGVTDVNEISKALEGYVDIATTGKSEFISLDGAVAQLTEQFRSERAALGETAGLTDEYISQILPRGLKMLQDEGKLSGKKVEDLTKEERAMAKLKGLTENFNIVKGNFTEQEKAGLIEQEKSNAQLKILQQELGKALKPVQILLFEALIPLFQQLANFTKNNPQLVLALSGLALAFAGIATVVAGVMAIMPALTFAFTALGGASVLGFLANALAGIQLAFGALMGSGGIGGAITALGMIMNPIGWVVLAIGALTAGVIWAYQNIEWFRNGVNDVFKKVVDYVMWAKDNWLQALGQILGFIISLPFKMYFWLKKGLDDMVKLVMTTDWNAVFKGIGDGFGRAIEGMGKMLQEFFKPENLKKLGNGFMDFIRGLLDGLGAGIPGSDKIINPIKDKLPRFATGGSFMVGGKGGVDKNLIQFMATKGERVIIQTPNQQANNVNSGNVTNQNFINYGNSGSGYIPSFMTNFG